MPSSKASKTVGAARVAGEQAQRATKARPRSTQSDEQPARGHRGTPQAPEAYTPTTWGQDVTSFELTCPSGQKCLAKELDIMRLMELGLLDRINGLSGIVNAQMLPKARGQRVPEVDVNELLRNKDALIEVMALVNSIVCESVVAPHVWPIVDEDGLPIPDEERKPERIYVDSVRLTDKFFIFNEVTGGLEQLAAFR